MNNCKEFQDLILTDHLDGELKGELKAQLDLHLKNCPSCQAFAREAQENLVHPFQKSQRHTVPGHVWENIKKSIQEEPEASQGILEQLKGLLQGISFPRLVPVLASFVLLVLVGSNVYINQQVKQVQNEEQVIYLASVFTETGGTADMSFDDLGTSIEQYFL